MKKIELLHKIQQLEEDLQRTNSMINFLLAKVDDMALQVDQLKHKAPIIPIGRNYHARTSKK